MGGGGGGGGTFASDSSFIYAQVSTYWSSRR